MVLTQSGLGRLVGCVVPVSRVECCKAHRKSSGPTVLKLGSVTLLKKTVSTLQLVLLGSCLSFFSFLHLQQVKNLLTFLWQVQKLKPREVEQPGSIVSVRYSWEPGTPAWQHPGYVMRCQCVDVGWCAITRIREVPGC